MQKKAESIADIIKDTRSFDDVKKAVERLVDYNLEIQRQISALANRRDGWIDQLQAEKQHNARMYRARRAILLRLKNLETRASKNSQRTELREIQSFAHDISWQARLVPLPVAMSGIPYWREQVITPWKKPENKIKPTKQQKRRGR